MSPDREQVLNRLWEVANLSPDMTRGSVTGQVKALSIIVAIQNFVPARHASPSRRLYGKQTRSCVCQRANLSSRVASQAASHNHRPPAKPCPRRRPAEVRPPLLSPSTLARPRACPERRRMGASDPAPSQPTFAHRVPLADGVPPYVPLFNSAPDTRVPFSIKVNPFKHRR